MIAALAAALFLPVGLVAQDVTASAASVCPAVGQDTDCGVVITISTANGAQVTQTGQGPYDGSDDTMVGVVNNSKLPISSLILSSGLNIFGFDSDGIDTYGVAGNAMDSTGYGGPDTYYTAINAAQTSGTVNFATPIPPGGSTYFGLENALASATSCQDVINGSVKPTASGANIDATFTPNQGLSLAQAEQLCGFVNFDWVQKITKQDDPSGFYARNLNGAFDPAVNGPVRLTSKRTPYSDPPQGGGYTYTKTPDNSYPFYYDPKVDLPQNQVGGMVMSFHDAPGDPCMIGGDDADTAACNGTHEPAGSFGSYVTHLAGINSDGSATDLGIGFTWNSNYSGSTGGIFGVKGTAGNADGNGTGGVTITSVQETTTYQNGGLTVTAVNGSPVGSSAGSNNSMLVYSGAQALAQGSWDTLSAQLSKIDSTPIGGRAVTLTIGSGSTAQSCTGNSDASGSVSCHVLVNQPLGPATVTATFAGDSSLTASSTSYTAIVFAYTTGGSYLVGNQSAGGLLPGQNVTFWGPQWAQQNKLTGGPAPASLHGLEKSIAPPDCQQLHSWTAPVVSDDGSAPPVQVPAYTAVIVTSRITNQRLYITGNSADVVIVSTNPGAPGTGTIVAALC